MACQFRIGQSQRATNTLRQRPQSILNQAADVAPMAKTILAFSLTGSPHLLRRIFFSNKINSQMISLSSYSGIFLLRDTKLWLTICQFIILIFSFLITNTKDVFFSRCLKLYLLTLFCCCRVRFYYSKEKQTNHISFYFSLFFQFVKYFSSGIPYL